MRTWMTPTNLNQLRLLRSLALALAPVALLLALGAAPATALSFAPVTHFFAGSGPVAVAVGDFNRDGRPDVVTANSRGDSVGVLLGDGHGRFAPRARFATGAGPEAVVVGDFNGDGKQDLATANATAGTVSLLLGDGYGGFGARTDFDAGQRPVALAVGDFDGDARQDLAASILEWDEGGACVLLGDGAGGFAPRIPVVTGPAAHDIAVGDFDADGRPDLATVVTDDFDGLAGVLLGDGTGHFSAMITYPQYLEPVAVAVGDLNGDGKQDLATAQTLQGGGEFGVLLGDGSGGFTGDARSGVHLCREVGCIALSDISGDRREDVISAAGSAVVVARGDGQGGLTKELHFPVGRTPADVAVADLNRDGLSDVVTADFYAGSVSVLLNGPHAAPVLRGLSPLRGSVGVVVTLTGLRFGVRRGAGVVRFGAVKATDYVSWSSTKIKVKVPAGAAAGQVRVTVKTVAGRSAARYFRRL